MSKIEQVKSIIQEEIEKTSDKLWALWKPYPWINHIWYGIQWKNMMAVKIRDRIEKEVKSDESLEDILERIWKRMCHFRFLYPNAWYWTIQDHYDWEYKWETLIECFIEFEKQLVRNWHTQ